MSSTKITEESSDNYIKSNKILKKILQDIESLLVFQKMRDKPPVKNLILTCEFIIQNNSDKAVASYNSTCSELLFAKSRRVTGDIWKDFLFCEMFEYENVFSLLAAQNKSDPPLNNALKHDLKILESLFQLNSLSLVDMICEIKQTQQLKTLNNYENNNNNLNTNNLNNINNIKQDQQEDKIQKMAFSAWGGTSEAYEKNKESKKAQKTAQQKLINSSINQSIIQNISKNQDLAKQEINQEIKQEVLDKNNFFSWSYDEPGKHEKYVSDNDLAPLYRHFLANPDWENNVEKLFDFHSNLGTGNFLKYNHFIATDNSFIGKNSTNAIEWDEVFCLGNQKEKLYANTLRFLHTSKGENMLFFGNSGMGKSALIYSILQELQPLRLVVIAQSNFENTINTIQKLFLQPVKFVVLFIDVQFTQNDLSALKALFDFQEKLEENNNVLVYATSKVGNIYTSFFSQKIKFDTPDKTQFIDLVEEMLRKKQVSVSSSEIEKVCQAFFESFKINTNSHNQNQNLNLNIMEAHQIAVMLARQYRNVK